MCAKTRLPAELQPLLKDEIVHAIEQANLGDEDTGIAKSWLVEQLPQAEIASEYGYVSSCVSHKMSKAIPRIVQAAKRLGYL